MSALRRRTRRASVLALTVALVGTLLALAPVPGVSPVAGALEVPPVAAPGEGHVTADPLPTVQINGVVWDQHILGNTVYVVGEFTHARPAGSPPGVNQTPRANVLAYDLATGQLINGFVANTNAQVKTVTSSPDGSRLYIGGQFTNVNGINRYRLAALDPQTGQVITSFSAQVDYLVNSIVATSDTVYAGGKFGRAGGGSGPTRQNLAAFSATNGSVLPWAPAANDRVLTLALGPDGDRVFVGGAFTTIDGTSRLGLAAVDATSGGLLPWNISNVVWARGPDGSITHLRVANGALYGGGYTFGRNSGNLEGVFKADPQTGAIEWLEDCHGDTYQLAPINGYVYKATHTHFCGNIGGWPQTDDRYTQWGEFMRHAVSYLDAAAGQVRRDQWSYHNLEGHPAPSVTSWSPEWQVGDHTGLSQATWSVTGNEQYVVYGGEFTSINGTAQQGLVRFAVRSIAPNAEGPRLQGDAFPIKVTSPAAGEARVAFHANFDRDDRTLTYQLLRNGSVVQTRQVASSFWDRPTIVFRDQGLAPGSNPSYRIRVADSSGNTGLSPIVNVTVAATGPGTPYAEQVLADNPHLYWRLGDAPGSTTADDATDVVAASANAMTFGRPGAIVGDPDTAVSPSSTSSRIVQPPFINSQGLEERHPARDELTVEAWFRTTSGSGGRILGFGNSATGTSSSSQADRVLYLTNNGRAVFGVRTRAEGTGSTSWRTNRVVQSGTGLNNGQWHHVVGTLDGDGMRIYVDGNLVASRSDVNSGHGYYGHWRVGADTLSGWSSAPSSTRLNGDIDEAAVYYHSLDAEQIERHWLLSGRGGNVPPTAAFTSAVSDLSVVFDGSGSADVDGSVVSYSWDFGDGSSGSGVSPSHVYAAAGSYDVILTVVDDGGASGSVSQSVTVTEPAVNVAPTAAFTSAVSDLSVVFDGSGSADVDGSVVSYSWDFGDGSSGSGVSPSHVYAAAGSYDVILTVVDDGGASGSVSQSVTVTEPDGPAILATDTFERTSLVGLGSADTGGSWTDFGNRALYVVAGGEGVHVLSGAGHTRQSYLEGVSALDASGVVDVRFDQAPNGGGIYSALALRRSGTSDYRARIRVMPTATTLTLYRTVAGSLQQLSATTVGGLTYAPGDVLRLAFEVEGTSPAALRAKVWKVGEAEPADWQLTATDTTASLQTAGGVGLITYLSGSSSAPDAARYDNLVVAAPGVALEVPEQPPVAAIGVTSDGLSIELDGTGSSDPDGTIESYAWDLGDGSSATGPTVSHTYAEAGTYVVTLEVTDSAGLSATAQRSLTLVAPGAEVVLVLDEFDRVVSNALGAAALGGTWIGSASASSYRVEGQHGIITLVSGGYTRFVTLDGASARDLDMTVEFTIDQPATGSGIYLSSMVRRIGTSDYRVRVRFEPTTTSIQILRAEGNSVTTLSAQGLPGLVLSPGTPYIMRVRAVGDGPTELSGKIWAVGDPEPEAWQVTASDATPALQAPGTVGIHAYLGGSVSATPVQVFVDRVRAVEASGA